jgi:hypothetical protein
MICFYYFLYRCMKNRIFYLFLIITLVLTACDQKLKNKSALISNIRVINNNIYILGSKGENKQILHFDFGDYNIVAEDLKDINALLDSDKDYCYIACPPVMIDSMIMGVLNKKGELYTFIYDQKRDEMALNRLADFSCKNINLPITSIGSNFLVSYFTKENALSYPTNGVTNSD